MNPLDVKTVIFSYIISDAICLIVIAFLWIQDRRRFPGLNFWLADYIMQFIALLLVALRGHVPDFVSMVVSNMLVIGGTILLFVGLEQFVGKRSSQVHNVVLLAGFVLVHTYFSVFNPSLEARNINFSLGLLIICFQSAWLIFRRADIEMRFITRTVGIIFSLYCLVNIVRIFVDLNTAVNEDFFRLNPFDTVMVMLYQMLFIALTFGLFLMVNRRLVVELESDVTERKSTEDALRLSEEKFFKAFHSSPDAILISRLSDGKLVEVNEGFSHLTGYSREEVLKSSTINLNIWVNPQDRDGYIAALLESQRVCNFEYEFRKKSGEILYGLYSGEIIYLGNESHILTIVRDITEHKQAQEEIHQANRKLQLQLDAIKELQVELREQAIRDPLTGLYNRRYLNEMLLRELAHAKRDNYPVSFVMIDIDHFKDVNDQYGHSVGDAILQKLSNLLMSQTRYGDIVCRYGGEEFLAILLNTKAEVAFQIAERWRLSFIGSTLLLDHDQSKATISSGISEFPSHGKADKELFFKADQAMYQAKAKGRNRVVIWQAEQME
jgi:diguanylate cyclase (GGDEF)-like protein/PAS domain S-box-containing protein